MFHARQPIHPDPETARTTKRSIAENRKNAAKTKELTPHCHDMSSSDIIGDFVAISVTYSGLHIADHLKSQQLTQHAHLTKLLRGIIAMIDYIRRFIDFFSDTEAQKTGFHELTSEVDFDVVSPNDIACASMLSVSDRVRSLDFDTRMKIYQLVDAEILQSSNREISKSIDLEGSSYNLRHRSEIIKLQEFAFGEPGDN